MVEFKIDRFVCTLCRWGDKGYIHVQMMSDNTDGACLMYKDGKP